MDVVTLNTLRKLKREGEKITCLTAYDASFAARLEEAGIEVILVGDSLGMVIQGRETTLPVTVDDMVYHTHNVRRGCRRPLVMADLPFLSYASPEQALATAARLMQEGGAEIVKLEGGAWLEPIVRLFAQQGVPVCVHLGLLPQSVHKLGGYRVQGRDENAARTIVADAERLAAAGADLLLLECVPTPVANEVLAAVEIPVIGIGAGAACDGQVLVLYDMLGITPGKRPRFSRDFLAESAGIPEALSSYVAAVKQGRFPTEDESFA